MPFCCGLKLSANNCVLFKGITYPDVHMDEGHDKRGNASLYVLGGVAIVIVLVWFYIRM
jgi:hypothetical protein